MAGHDESSVSRKKSSDSVDEISTFSAENMQNNAKIIYYSRTFMSIIGGVVAGILGFTGLTGFIFYFLVMAIMSVGLAAKAGFSAHPYFDSWNQILLDGFLGGLLSFVLFWTCLRHGAYFLKNPVWSLLPRRHAMAYYKRVPEELVRRYFG